MEALRLLRRAHQAGLAVALTGDQVVVRGPKQAEPLVRLLAAHKGEIIEALTDAVSWAARYEEALNHWGLLHAREEAMGIAWGEMQKRWHRLHGARSPEGQCAGCGKPIGGQTALSIGDGNRVHLDDAHGLDCAEAYSKQWRGAATRALIALGLQAPAGEGAS